MREQQQIPVEPYVQALKDQRAQALDQAAEWQALATALTAERDQLRAELEQRHATGDAASPSSSNGATTTRTATPTRT